MPVVGRAVGSIRDDLPALERDGTPRSLFVLIRPRLRLSYGPSSNKPSHTNSHLSHGHGAVSQFEGVLGFCFEAGLEWGARAGTFIGLQLLVGLSP